MPPNTQSWESWVKQSGFIIVVGVLSVLARTGLPRISVISNIQPSPFGIVVQLMMVAGAQYFFEL